MESRRSAFCVLPQPKSVPVWPGSGRVSDSIAGSLCSLCASSITSRHAPPAVRKRRMRKNWEERGQQTGERRSISDMRKTMLCCSRRRKGLDLNLLKNKTANEILFFLLPFLSCCLQHVQAREKARAQPPHQKLEERLSPVFPVRLVSVADGSGFVSLFLNPFLSHQKSHLDLSISFFSSFPSLFQFSTFATYLQYAHFSLSDLRLIITALICNRSSCPNTYT